MLDTAAVEKISVLHTIGSLTKTSTLTLSRQLLHDISEAGGTLTLNPEEDETNYTRQLLEYVHAQLTRSSNL